MEITLSSNLEVTKNSNLEVTKRFNEIDFMKGLAVIFMVIFHYFYLGKHMGKMEVDTSQGIYWFLAKFAHLTFIFMVGVNMVVTRLNSKNKEEYKQKQYKRVLHLALLACIISVVSYVAFPDKWVKFGILHFIATGILLLMSFVDKPKVSLGISISIFLVFLLNQMGMLRFLYSIIPDIPAFILGFFNTRFASLDHFAIIKFLPVMALGIFIGHLFYKSLKEGSYRKVKKLEKISKEISKDNLVVKIGQHSLLIYMVHFVILYMYFKIMV